MKVIIEMETPEERAMMGAEKYGRFVQARSTAIFTREEWVPVANYQSGVPIGYKKKLYVEVALDSLEYVKIPIIPQLKEGKNVPNVPNDPSSQIDR